MTILVPTPEQNVIWEPLPGSQALLMSCPCNHILYEGTRGPGKTDGQVMFFRQFVGMGFGRFWRGVIFDREYKNLDDLISKSLRWFPQFKDGARFLSSRSDYKWVWPTGEELLFRQIKKKADYWNYHGQEFPFIGWNELSKFPTSDLYEEMMSCNRSSFLPEKHSPDKENPIREIPLVVLSTTNPYGAGHNWVKKRFIDAAPAGKIITITKDVFNPRTQKREPITKSQVRIFGSYKENIYLPPEYILELESITDPNKRKAWLWGDWDVVAGGALDGVWNRDVHIIPRFKIPKTWRLDRSLDWGSTHPFSVGFWAEANGESVTLPDGRIFTPPRGTLIRIHEFYGAEEVGTNKGIKMSPTDVAKNVKRIQTELNDMRWVQGKFRPGPADGQIFDKPRSDVESIAKKMEDHGITWTRADKSHGSRKQGLELTRNAFENSLRGEGPGIYIMEHCTAAISTLPTLPRDEDDPDDVDTDAEDHPYDDIRYRVVAGNNRCATVIHAKFRS